jgi:hypothetical protein
MFDRSTSCPTTVATGVLGGSTFFTVNLLERRGNDLLTRHIDTLRDTVRIAHRARPFTIDALRRASRSFSLHVDAAAGRRRLLGCDGG